MRIVGLKEFMTLEKILYSEYGEGFEDSSFSIKWNNCGKEEFNDWVLSHISPRCIEYQLSYYEDGIRDIENAEKDSSVNLKMDFEGTVREASYYANTDPIRFAVYEKDDIKNLIDVLSKLV